jgi:hypothetical protein
LAEVNQALENRFTKLMLSSVLRTLDALHPGIDASETVHRNMLGICESVRDRALQAVEDAGNSEIDPAQATAEVDQLIGMIDEYFAYAALAQFGDLEVVKSD